MKVQRVTLIGALIVIGMACVPAESQGQADPSWLRSWNEARESRPAALTSRGRIAGDSEAGQPLIIRGRVFNPDGTAADGVVVHAYHRDHDGLDFGPGDDSLTTWRLQGWVETDGKGQFEFRTIRPAPDHLGREGAHIHFTLESNDHGRQWAPTVFLADDPLVSPEQRRRSKAAGAYGWVRDVETRAGVQHVAVRFRLKQDPDF
jgi:protocatechuate 3,4-dioxygenase, beta subunit